MMSAEESQDFDQLFHDDVYLELKNSLFSYVLRKRLIHGLVPGEDDVRLLDLGCGISPVAPAGRLVVYSDVAPAAMRHLQAELPGAHYVALDATQLPFGDESLDTIVCSEVLEHIEDDRAALEEIQRVLRPGGRFILTAPIHPGLYSFDDEFVGHFRRYDLDVLTMTLATLGLQPIRKIRVSGLLEKVATYLMVRMFTYIGDGTSKTTSRRRWWFGVYRAFNYVWSYIAAWQGRFSPWRLTTIALFDCRKTATEGRDKVSE